VIAADLTDAAQPPRVMSEVVTKAGRIDVLVNNAGVMLLGPIVGAPLEEWERMIDINVRGLLHCAHAALPHLLQAAEQGPRKVADLVNISSVAERKINNGSGVYNLTKHGVDPRRPLAERLSSRTRACSSDRNNDFLGARAAGRGRERATSARPALRALTRQHPPLRRPGLQGPGSLGRTCSR
jgi:short chain dehydrogenase